MIDFKATDKWYEDAAKSEEGCDMTAGVPMTDELKPNPSISTPLKSCAHCGGEAVLDDLNNKFYFITCTKCNCGTAMNVESDEAIKAWNKRVTDENLSDTEQEAYELSKIFI